ncbi:MAG: M23 family metallopeptidase [Myxococcota bacterium]|nr:M23 family metallopeptidase [Myxococcota bacterium]
MQHGNRYVSRGSFTPQKTHLHGFLAGLMVGCLITWGLTTSSTDSEKQAPPASQAQSQDAEEIGETPTDQPPAPKGLAQENAENRRVVIRGASQSPGKNIEPTEKRQVQEALARVDELPELEGPPAKRLVNGRVKRNQFVSDILIAAGCEALEADQAIRSFKGIFDFRRSRPGDHYELEMTPDGTLLSFFYKAGPDEQFVTNLEDDGQFLAKRKEINLHKEIIEVHGTINVSMWDAFMQAGESPNLAMSLAEAFQFDIDFYHDTRKGDQFRFWVEKFTFEGELVRYGRIWSAEYQGSPESPVGTKRLYWFENKSANLQGYYDAKGKAAQRAFLRSPLRFNRISSGFGYRRHPILGRRHFHGGIDYAAPTGTPVQAVAQGRVTYAGNNGAAGNMVKIRHTGVYESLYLHLSRILVRSGQSVSQSTVIGKVGSTGRSTGPHLDFRLKHKGKYMNPRKHVAPRTKAIPKSQLTTYKTSIKPWVEKFTGA